MNDIANEKKTLMSSLNYSENNVDMIRHIAELSQRLIDKFNRVDDITKGDTGSESLPEKYPQPPNIIELFDEANDRIKISINIIEKNIEEVMNMIE